MNDTLQRKIDDARVEGWSLMSEQGEDRAVMVKRDYGSLGAHILIFVLFGWWTLGLANVIYMAKRYWMDADKRVIRVEDDG